MRTLNPSRSPVGLAALAATAVLVSAPALWAEPSIAVDGHLTATGGGAVPDGAYGLVVALYANVDAVEPLFKELHGAVPVHGGFFQLVIGGADPAKPLPAGLFADHPQAWVGVQVVPEAKELPRTQLLAVPYAFRAAHAGTAGSAASAAMLTCVGCVDKSHVDFAYAGSTSKGGPALDLDCSGCVDAGEIAPGSVTSDHLAAGAVTSAKIAAGAVGADALAVKWAASETKGGAALLALDLQCSGCVGADELAPGAVAALLPIATKDVLGGIKVGDHLDIDNTGLLAVHAADFLASSGGTVSGALKVGGQLTVQGSADLSGGALAGFRVESGGALPACNGANAGEMRFHSGDKHFYGCTGSQWKALHK